MSQKAFCTVSLRKSIGFLGFVIASCSKPLMIILAFNTNVMAMPRHCIVASCDSVGVSEML